MRRSYFPTVFFATLILLFGSPHPGRAQTAPHAYEGGLPLMVGGGIANDNIDFGAGRRMTGIAAWADWDLSGARFIPRGLGLEVEGKTIRYGVPEGFSQMREETLLGGVRYAWRHYQNLQPFAKGMWGIGSIDFPPYPGYGHDTRTVSEVGGGVDYRIHGNIWLRAQYEYQIWPGIFGGTLTPNGFNVGASYNFRHRHWK